jgi:hypothetical protein
MMFLCPNPKCGRVFGEVVPGGLLVGNDIVLSGYFVIRCGRILGVLPGNRLDVCQAQTTWRPGKIKKQGEKSDGYIHSQSETERIVPSSE